MGNQRSTTTQNNIDDSHKHVDQNKSDISVCITYNSIYMKYKYIYVVRICREIWVPFKDVKICFINPIVIVQIKVKIIL